MCAATKSTRCKQDIGLGARWVPGIRLASNNVTSVAEPLRNIGAIRRIARMAGDACEQSKLIVLEGRQKAYSQHQRNLSARKGSKRVAVIEMSAVEPKALIDAEL